MEQARTFISHSELTGRPIWSKIDGKAAITGSFHSSWVECFDDIKFMRVD